MDETLNYTVIDPTVPDRLVRVPTQELHDRLVDKYNLNAGHKKSLNKNPFYQLRADISHLPSHVALGGSGTTTAFTLKRLLKDKIDITFVSVAPDDAKHQWIRDLFKQAGIKYVTPRVHTMVEPETAESIFLIPPSGKRTIATYSGTFGEVLAPHISASRRDCSLLHYRSLNLIENSDVLHILLTNMADSRLGKDFIEEQLGLRWDAKKILVASLPTNEKTTDEYRKEIQNIIPSVHVLAGNWGEAEEVYGVKNAPTQNYHQRGISAAFALNEPDDLARWKANLKQPQVAFITDDERAMWVITAHKVQPIPVDPVPDEQIVNTGGSGDSTFAGELAGYFSGLEHEKSAQIGGLLGRACVKHLHPCLPNPEQVVARAPRFYEDLYHLPRPWEVRRQQQRINYDAAAAG